MKSRLICITGQDGSGKTTLINALSDKLESVVIANIWDLMSSNTRGLPFKSKKDIDTFLCDLTPNSRLLFLSHALRYSIDSAFHCQKEIILMDSYYYKYFASEMALGADPELVNALEQSFPVPELVINLILPVEMAVQRKAVFSRYECGLAEDANVNTFLSFQEKVHQKWLKYPSSKWCSIDSTKAPKEVLYQALKEISITL